MLKVIEGTVDFESKASNQNISVKAGQSASADKSGLKPIAPFDIKKENQMWEDKKTQSNNTNPKQNFTYLYVIAGIAVIIIIAFLLLKRKKH